MPMDTTQRILKLYECSAPNNELHKDKWLSNEKVISPYVPKDNNSISNPHIIIHTFEGLIAYNYCYIDDYQRYYFIEDMILLPQGQVELVCKVDVLYSFKNSIGELVVHETRATNGTSNYLIDEEVATQINAKPVVKPLEFKNNMKIKGRGWADLCYVVRWFTKVNYIADASGRATSQLSGASRNEFANIPTDNNPTSSQLSIGDLIAQYAKSCYEGYDNYLNKPPVNNYRTYSYGCVYTQASEWAENKLVSFNDVTEIAYPLLYDDDHINIPATRFDTVYSGYDTVDFNGTTRNTNMNIVDSTKIADWNSNHPNHQIDTDLRWNGWDCSQFAWRCCLFNNQKQNPIDINSTTVGSGKDASTGSELEFLSNHGALVHQVATLADLLPGDLIFSGHGDGSGRYFVGWSESQNKWVKGNSGDSRTGLTNIIDVNHVRVYIGNGEYVDTTGNTIDERTPKGNLHKSTLGTLTLQKNDSFDKVTDVIEGSDKHIRVCRPSLLWGSEYQN